MQRSTRRWLRRAGPVVALVVTGAVIPSFVVARVVSSGTTPRPKKTRLLQRTLRRIGHPLRTWPLLMGLPSPPYTRRNAIIIETIGRRSGKRHRVPVGFLEENGKLIVVVEDGLASSWVRNALARAGHLRVFLHGRWREARLEPRPGNPEPYLRRMNKVHAAFVRIESSVPALVEITPE